jgi:peptidoglycan/xylan/chitin deacetylase (PgdA/CDA1 family)
MLSWNEIGEMKNSGFSFGAHTLTHPDLTRLPRDRAEAEICRSKAIIETALGEPVRCFAYPFGRYNRQTREIVRRNFDCACSDKLGLAGPDDLYALERVDAYYLRTERLLDLMPTKIFPWYVRARSLPRQIRRAITLG